VTVTPVPLVLCLTSALGSNCAAVRPVVASPFESDEESLEQMSNDEEAMAMKLRLRQALEAAFAAGPRVHNVRLASEPLRAGVNRRPAASAAVTLAPISVAAPRPQTDADVHEFVLQQFPPMARRLAS
jgi:hypothetical protein